MIALLQEFALFSGPQHQFVLASSYDELQQRLTDSDPSLAIILVNQADGMEGVYLTRERRPTLPLFWFSDDAGFGMQSHRLECDYFAVKPITAQKLRRALSRCRHIGIPLELRS